MITKNGENKMNQRLKQWDKEKEKKIREKKEKRRLEKKIQERKREEGQKAFREWLKKSKFNTSD
jgi:hypothetical protein